MQLEVKQQTYVAGLVFLNMAAMMRMAIEEDWMTAVVRYSHEMHDRLEEDMMEMVPQGMFEYMNFRGMHKLRDTFGYTYARVAHFITITNDGFVDQIALVELR